jgi:lysozyme family protein
VTEAGGAAQSAAANNPSLRAYNGTDEFATVRPSLRDLLKANPGIKTNQDLINHFYKLGGNGWDGAQKQASQYGADLNQLVKDRKGSAQAYAASLPGPAIDAPTATAPAPAPAPAASAEKTALAKLLDQNPSLKTNQDLINYFYKQGSGTWSGAQKVAKGYGVDLNALVADRKGAIKVPAGAVTEKPAPKDPPKTSQPAPVEKPAEPKTPERTALQKLLDENPGIKTNQDLINYFFRQGGNDWARSEAAARKVGADLNALVKNRKGSAAEYAAAAAKNAPVSGPITVDQSAGVVKATGTLRSAYDDYAKSIEKGIQIDSKYSSQIEATMKRFEERMPYIDEIARQADLPRELVAAIWFRESSSLPTDVYLHNGQKLGKTTTLVPKGIYFGKDQFVEAAVHALGMKSNIKKALGLHYGSKDFAAMAAFTEAYNGFGYRNKGYASAYVTAGSNLYKGGRYVADGKFDPNSWDQRPGTLILMAEMARRFPA